MRDEIAYEFRIRFTPGEYVGSQILEEGRGFCCRKSALLCTLGRAAGIPGALALADMRDASLPPDFIKALGTDVMYHHGLAAFHLGGRWLKLDVALSPDVVSRKRTAPVVFDGDTDALHASETVDGQPSMTYMRFHGIYPDVPFDQMMTAFHAGYAGATPAMRGSMGFPEP